MDLVGAALGFHVILDAPGIDYPVSDAAGRHASFWIPCNENSPTHCEYRSGDYRDAQMVHVRTPCRELSVRLVDADHMPLDLSRRVGSHTKQCVGSNSPTFQGRGCRLASLSGPP